MLLTTCGTRKEHPDPRCIVHNRPEQGRLTSNKEYAARYGEDWIYEVAGAFTAFAKERGFNPDSFLDGGADRDRDGQSNLAEYLAGTIP